jgi:hypothetical protein
VALRISRTVFSALSGMRLLVSSLAPQQGYDEPGIISYAIRPFCPTSADGLHAPELNSDKEAPHFKMLKSNLRIVSLNIRRGGDRKSALLARWLLSKSPTVVILPKWRNDATGRRITETLEHGGFTLGVVREKSRRNSVLAVSIKVKSPFIALWGVNPAIGHQSRLRRWSANCRLLFSTKLRQGAIPPSMY